MRKTLFRSEELQVEVKTDLARDVGFPIALGPESWPSPRLTTINVPANQTTAGFLSALGKRVASKVEACGRAV